MFVTPFLGQFLNPGYPYYNKFDQLFDSIDDIQIGIHQITNEDLIVLSSLQTQMKLYESEFWISTKKIIDYSIRNIELEKINNNYVVNKGLKHTIQKQLNDLNIEFESLTQYNSILKNELNKLTSYTSSLIKDINIEQLFSIEEKNIELQNNINDLIVLKTSLDKDVVILQEKNINIKNNYLDSLINMKKYFNFEIKILNDAYLGLKSLNEIQDAWNSERRIQYEADVKRFNIMKKQYIDFKMKQKSILVKLKKVEIDKKCMMNLIEWLQMNIDTTEEKFQNTTTYQKKKLLNNEIISLELMEYQLKNTMNNYISSDMLRFYNDQQFNENNLSNITEEYVVIHNKIHHETYISLKYKLEEIQTIILELYNEKDLIGGHDIIDDSVYDNISNNPINESNSNLEKRIEDIKHILDDNSITLSEKKITHNELEIDLKNVETQLNQIENTFNNLYTPIHNNIFDKYQSIQKKLDIMKDYIEMDIIDDYLKFLFNVIGVVNQLFQDEKKREMSWLVIVQPKSDYIFKQLTTKLNELNETLLDYEFSNKKQELDIIIDEIGFLPKVDMVTYIQSMIIPKFYLNLLMDIEYIRSLILHIVDSWWNDILTKRKLVEIEIETEIKADELWKML